MRAVNHHKQLLAITEIVIVLAYEQAVHLMFIHWVAAGRQQGCSSSTKQLWLLLLRAFCPPACQCWKFIGITEFQNTCWLQFVFSLLKCKPTHTDTWQESNMGRSTWGLAHKTQIFAWIKLRVLRFFLYQMFRRYLFIFQNRRISNATRQAQ